MKDTDPDFAHRTRTNVRYAVVAYDLSGNLIAAGEVVALGHDDDGNLTALITRTPTQETDANPEDTP